MNGLNLPPCLPIVLVSPVPLPAPESAIMSLRSMPIATRAALSFALITALLVITGIFP